MRIAGTWEAPIFQVENKEPITSDLIYADEDFFKLFTCTFIKGSPGTALSIIGIKMTEQLSQKKEVLRNMLLKIPEANELTFTQYYPGNIINYWTTQLVTNGETKESTMKICRQISGKLWSMKHSSGSKMRLILSAVKSQWVGVLSR